MNDLDTKPLGAIPTAGGGIARLAYARARRAGIELKPLLKKAGLTDQRIKDRGSSAVQHQIQFLNRCACLVRRISRFSPRSYLTFGVRIAFMLRLFCNARRRSAASGALQLISNEGLSLKCLEEDDIRIVFDYVGIARHSDRHQIEFFMTVLIRLCRRLTGVRLVPSRARRIAAAIGGSTR